MLSHFFKGMKATRFEEVAYKFSLNHIDNIIRPKAMRKILWHKKKGHRIIVVSASIDFWLKPWCDKYELELISTKLEIKNGRLTGKFKGKNCFGIEKVIRIYKTINLDEYEHIYSYGDSKGDKELLNLADSPNYRIF